MYLNLKIAFLITKCLCKPITDTINYKNALHIAGKQSDLYKLDTKNKTPEENIKDIIQGLYVKKPIYNDTSPTNKNNHMDFKLGLSGMHKNSSDSRRLSYLNAFVTLLCKEDRSNLGFTPDELMTW